jgi:hypothetical protein
MGVGVMLTTNLHLAPKLRTSGGTPLLPHSLFTVWTELKIKLARRDEVTGVWRKLHNEELNDLYCSPTIVRVIKSRRMRWAGHGGGDRRV